ncbi:alpha/beta fold hydrolase [Dactylosporangium sp. CA-092794]|uniref:alpha/beta fold hydrolase n=1 Tax=Dactylosporangium sp. CA-092794 TaxID=3239929 RepID=UPI003D8D79DA
MHEAHYLTIDGRLSFVEVFGEGGPDVLCVHSAGQSGVQYRYAAPEIARLGYRVIVADMPGHGRTEPAADGPVADLGMYSDWSLRVLDLFGATRPYLIGCSIGGAIVMDMAVKAHTRLAGVVAMAAADSRIVHPNGVRPLVLEDSGAPSIRDRTYYGGLVSSGRLVPPDRAELIALMHCREDWHVTFADGTAQGRLDLWDQLPSITCPVVVVAGEDDPFIPHHLIRQTAQRIPTATYELLEGYGHYPMEELPDFAQRFDGWVKHMSARGETVMP